MNYIKPNIEVINCLTETNILMDSSCGSHEGFNKDNSFKPKVTDGTDDDSPF